MNFIRGSKDSISCRYIVKIKKMLSLFRVYDLLYHRPKFILNALNNKKVLEASFSVIQITSELLPIIENSRPGYTKMAQYYLNNSHIGFGIMYQDLLVSMAWLYHNNTKQRKKVMYYPLDPNHTWFHADWTHPDFRGRGFHKYLLNKRIQYVYSFTSNPFIEINVARENTVSAHNISKCGFVKSGKLYVFGRGRLCYGWKKT